MRKHDLTIAWGGNPRSSKVPPSSGPKGKTMAKKKKGHEHHKSSASKHPKHGKPKGHKKGCGCFACVKHRSNPSEGHDHHEGKKPTTTQTVIGLLAGRLLVKGLAQNVVPSAYRGGPILSAVQAGLGWLTRFGIQKISLLKFARPYADGVMFGGFVAASEVVDPVVLPKIQWNLLGYYDNRVTPAETLGDNRYADGRTGPTTLGAVDRRVLRMVVPTGATDPGTG